MSYDIDLLKRVTETHGDPATADGEAVQNVIRVLHNAEESGLDLENEPWLQDVYYAVRNAFYSPADWNSDD